MKLSSNFLRDAKKLLGRVRYTRGTLPIITHILATLDASGITLAVTDLDQWLETRADAVPESNDPTSFLIPAGAMAAAIRADKNTTVTFTLRGGKKRQVLHVSAQCGGIQMESTHPTLDVADFPPRPNVIGPATTVPAYTMESLAVVAVCASTDETRYVLNGVLFTPDDGGTLVATDGHRLGSAPALVPPVPFILANAAVHVLTHPDFTGQGAEITVSEVADDLNVSIRSGKHLLVSRTIAGNYPNYRQVIPHLVPELVTISGDRRPGVIAWLRALPDTRDAVRLSWEKRGQLTLTRTTESSGTAVLRVPVEIHGNPPVIAFSPRYLADALEIGSTLCLSDGLTPGVCRHPSGRFCLIMPCRVTGEVADVGGEKADQAPAPVSAPAPAPAPALAA